ncbi:MAG: two-component regulator propeller domain-containing protein [Ferruginibacter sp.]
MPQRSFDYAFRQINQSDGLLHNEVLSVTQDARGFIWIATRNGLQRYDGSSFSYYPDMLSDPLGGQNFGAEIYADKTNNYLWISNGVNLERMNLARYHFTLYDSEKLIKDSSFIFTPYRDQANDSWLLGDKAIYYHHPITKRNILYQVNILPENSRRTSFIASDSTRNAKWITPGSGLFLFEKKTRKVYSHKFNPNHHPLLQIPFAGDASTQAVCYVRQQAGYLGYYLGR